MEVKAAAGAGRSGYCSSSSNSSIQSDQESADLDLRRGPWTVEEDFKLINYIANHGEGRWNSLARCAGIKIISCSSPRRVIFFRFLVESAERDRSFVSINTKRCRVGVLIKVYACLMVYH